MISFLLTKAFLNTNIQWTFLIFLILRKQQLLFNQNFIGRITLDNQKIKLEFNEIHEMETK